LKTKMGNVRLDTCQAYEDFGRGLCFMATGGGGGLEPGLNALLAQLEAVCKIEWWMRIASLGKRGRPQSQTINTSRRNAEA
jgi:hypothetical protein